MKLEKAIEILTILASQTQPGAEQDELDALKLGTEALKRIKYMRCFKIVNPEKKLPGETKN